MTGHLHLERVWMALFTFMDIAFQIPEWLLWVLGIPAGLFVLFLIVMGAAFLLTFRGGGYY